MRLAYFSVVLNHHQAHLADEMSKRLGEDYIFVELKPGAVEKKGDTQDFSTRSYLLEAWKSKENYDKALKIAKSFDVCVFSSYETLPFQIERMKCGLMSFEMTERWLKRGLLSFISPRLIKNIGNHCFRGWSLKPLYKLCCSAYCPDDQYMMHTFLNKCYKWGYFTKIEDLDIDSIIKTKRHEKICKIMWCARFIDCKHPEIPVRLAARLKEKGYEFCVDMYGSGPMLEKTRQLAIKLKVADIVHFKGNLPNEQILKEMQGHDIFIFTSDRREGWGAVANEAMSNGCVLVASDEIGSVPYLVKDGVNGCVFKSGDMNSLIEKVESLINDRDYMGSLALNAYNTMKNEWSPACAARNLLLLIADLQSGKDTSITDGPCSKALPINHA